MDIDCLTSGLSVDSKNCRVFSMPCWGSRCLPITTCFYHLSELVTLLKRLSLWN